MSNIKDVFSGLNKKKVKVFLLFLLCSFLAWSVSKLSDDYESKAKFDLSFQNLPDSLLFNVDGNTTLSAKIKASGFQFLRYSINPKNIKVDLNNVLEQDGDYFLTAKTLEDQLERQLPKSINLIELDDPVLYVDLYQVASKNIRVIPKLTLQLAQNHLLKGSLTLEPDSIQIKGPKKIISSIGEIATVPMQMQEVTGDFSTVLKLSSLDSIGNIVASHKEVKISGEVVRFSEKEFTVAIKDRNVPEGFRLRMFPDKIDVLCKAEIDRLKTLQATDFNIYVDYNQVIENKYLFIELGKTPNDVFSVRLLQNQIEFVLEKL